MIMQNRNTRRAHVAENDRSHRTGLIWPRDQTCRGGADLKHELPVRVYRFNMPGTDIFFKFSFVFSLMPKVHSKLSI